MQIDKNAQVYSNKYFIQIVEFNHIGQLLIFKKYIQKIFTNKQLNDRFTAFNTKINALRYVSSSEILILYFLQHVVEK